MNIQQTIITQILALVSLVTTTGVLLHDTNIDKAVTSSYLSRTNHEKAGTLKPGSMPHTHHERGSFAEMTSQAIKNPRTTPRNTRDRRYLWMKRVSRGQGALEGYSMNPGSLFG